MWIMYIYREGDNAMSLLIKDTTPEQRAQIVAASLGEAGAACDGCAPGMMEMYQDYIDGKAELRDINMRFRAGYISGNEGPTKSDCGYI